MSLKITIATRESRLALWQAEHVKALLRAGVHGGLASWVVDRAGAEATCQGTRQVSGVLEGDGGDLWRFVRDADVALGVSH